MARRHRRIAALLVATLSTAEAARAGQCHDVQDPLALVADPARAAADRTHPRGPRRPASPDHDPLARGAALLRPGPPPDLRVQPPEALRAFKEAARLDPDCAMAYWGWALVLGPNLNLPMKPEVVAAGPRGRPEGHGAAGPGLAQGARVHRGARQRYAQRPEAERAPLDAAFADAMKRAPREVPGRRGRGDALRGGPHEPLALELLDAGRTAARAHAGRPRGPGARGGARPAATRARCTTRSTRWRPWIPTRRCRRADALRALAPAAGHLVHMPSHIYMQVGRYAEALRGQPPRRRGGRGLPHAVPEPGHLSAHLLPAQPALPGVGGDHAGAARRRAGRRAQGRLQGPRRTSARTTGPCTRRS